MRKKVLRVGNSAAITLSPPELAALGLAVGDQVEVIVRAGVLQVSRVNVFSGRPVAELFAVIDAARRRR